jgi:hypothetical protein
VTADDNEARRNADRNTPAVSVRMPKALRDAVAVHLERMNKNNPSAVDEFNEAAAIRDLLGKGLASVGLWPPD